MGSTIRIFESVDARPAGVLTGQLDDVRRLAFSPDGLTLASTGIDHNLKLWHVATARPVLTLPQGEMQADDPAYAFYEKEMTTAGP